MKKKGDRKMPTLGGDEIDMINGIPLTPTDREEDNNIKPNCLDLSKDEIDLASV